MPPLVGVAVNVTCVPAHMVVADALMLTDGATLDVTVIVIGLDVAIVGEAQLNEEVITTVTTSPFASVVDWNVGLLVPALLPFIFH